MKYYNEFKDVKVGDEVEWVNSTSGIVIKGKVTDTSKESESFTVCWSDTKLTNVYKTTDNTLCSSIRKPNTETLSVNQPKDLTEDKIKELIIYLIQVNQTNRACEVIEILRKHVNDQTLNGYKLK